MSKRYSYLIILKKTCGCRPLTDFVALQLPFGHLLCYLCSLEKLNDFSLKGSFHRLDIRRILGPFHKCSACHQTSFAWDTLGSHTCRWDRDIGWHYNKHFAVGGVVVVDDAVVGNVEAFYWNLLITLKFYKTYWWCFWLKLLKLLFFFLNLWWEGLEFTS